VSLFRAKPRASNSGNLITLPQDEGLPVEAHLLLSCASKFEVKAVHGPRSEGSVVPHDLYMIVYEDDCI
jgi:hypothetical protein